jgi:hypothetical protein
MCALAGVCPDGWLNWLEGDVTHKGLEAVLAANNPKRCQMQQN